MSRGTRIAGAMLLAWIAFAQTPPQKPPAPQVVPELPPDEDAVAVPKEYVFNPVQSKREVEVGLQYFHKGNFKAAANRFSEATKWNDGNAEAWLRLAEAEEKEKNVKGEREALAKYLQLAPEAKNAAEIRKKLAKLGPSAQSASRAAVVRG
jgi:predicted Zn-dependent protease